MKCLIIGIQEFQNNNKKFILKEIAILSSKFEIQHFIIKPPYGYHILTPSAKLTNNWLTKSNHGFHWSDSETHFCDVINFLKVFINRNITVYIKGEQKQAWIANIFKNFNVIDINKQDSTSLNI